MTNEEKKVQEGGHFICLGGCQGVSQTPGTCQAETCLLKGQELDKCDCSDNKHNDFHPVDGSI